MEDYPITVFYSPNDKCYIAHIPDLEGCSAFGETPDKAVREVMVSKQLWLDAAREHGDPIPRPRLIKSPVKTVTDDLSTQAPSCTPALETQARCAASGLSLNSIPLAPGIYAWFYDNRCAYVGKAARLRERIRTHLAVTRDLSRSAFRRNVAAFLDIAPTSVTVARPPQLTPYQVQPVNDWIRRCDVCWSTRADEMAALAAEAAAISRLKPFLNRI